MSAVLLLGDSLEQMASLPPHCVDMVMCDLPYGTTACKWDSIISLDALWAAYRRIVKPDGVIVLTAAQPFTSALVMSNVKDYRHCWVWDKSTISNPLQAKYQPLRQHEDVLVFAQNTPRYFPQKTDLHLKSKWRQYAQNEDAAAPANLGATGETQGKYPKTIQKFPAAKLVEKVYHPTQKPIALMGYLIRTYTGEGMTVLDNTMGSGTTGVAAIKAGRNFIGIERDPTYFAIAWDRVYSS